MGVFGGNPLLPTLPAYLRPPQESDWALNLSRMSTLMGITPQTVNGGGGKAPGLNLPAGWTEGGGSALVAANPGLFGQTATASRGFTPRGTGLQTIGGMGRAYVPSFNQQRQNEVRPWTPLPPYRR